MSFLRETPRIVTVPATFDHAGFSTSTASQEGLGRNAMMWSLDLLATSFDT